MAAGDCAQFFEALARCQRDHSASARFGACSAAHRDLSRCLAAGAQKSGGRGPATKEALPPGRPLVAQQQQRYPPCPHEEAEEAAIRQERAELEADCFTIFTA